MREILTLDASFDCAENLVHFLIAVTLTRLKHSIEAYFALLGLDFKIFTPRCLGIRLKSMFETVEFLRFFPPIFKLQLQRNLIQIVDKCLEVWPHLVVCSG